MKRTAALLLACLVSIGASWGAYRALAPEAPSLARFVPAGPLLYLEAKDFQALLGDWNGSEQKARWVKSQNYELYSRSPLLLRFEGAGEQFAGAAGFPPEMNFLTQVAGTRSALALYDIGKLELLYLTKLPAPGSLDFLLSASGAKVETRSAAGATFYVRRDPASGREVAFALRGDTLILATREELLAGSLGLLAGGQERTIEAEPWWSESVASAGAPGDLRMVLDLERIVPSPYFRSYWIERNFAEMKQYRAAVSDLFRSGPAYREERLLLKKAATPGQLASNEATAAVAELARLVPEGSGRFEVRAAPSAADCFEALEARLLAPHRAAPAPLLTAPELSPTSGETGSGSDLETRIDQGGQGGQGGPQRSEPAAGPTRLQELFQKTPVRAILKVQSTDRDRTGVFVRIHSGFAFLASADWPETTLRSALLDSLRPALTVGSLGVEWRSRSGVAELDGLGELSLLVRGKLLLVSDDPRLLDRLAANLNRKAIEEPALVVAGFDHSRERENFLRLTGLLDRPAALPGAGVLEAPPQFFSGNLASLSSVLSDLVSEKLVVRESPGRVVQTVTYRWSR